MNELTKIRNEGEKSQNKGLVYRVFSFLTGSPIAEEQKVKEKGFRASKIPVIPFFKHLNEFAVTMALLTEVVPEHDGAIKAKKRWATNEGFTVTNMKPNTLVKRSQISRDEVTDEQINLVEDLITQITPEGDSLHEVVCRVILDLESIGNAYIELIRFEADGENIFKIRHHDGTTALLIRREDQITVGFSADWRKAEDRNSEAPVFELPLYKGKLTEWKNVNGSERCVIHLKHYRSGRFFYGLPESISSFLSQKVGFEINRHNLDRLETDFFPRMFFEFFNTDGMSQQQQEEHLNAMIDTFTKAGRERQGIFAQYNEATDSQTKIHKLEADKTGDFMNLRSQARQDILTAHGVHPVIAGVLTAGSLGSSKEIREIFELFNITVITPLQNFLVERLLTPVMTEMSEFTEEFEDLYLDLQTSTPMSFMGDLQINSVMTVDEGREEIGLQPIGDDRGSEIITRTTTNQTT